MLSFIAFIVGLFLLAMVAAVGWFVVSIALMIFRWATGRTAAAGGPYAARCPRFGCRTFNPKEANFCRRCGSDLLSAVVPAPLRATDRPSPALAAAR